MIKKRIKKNGVLTKILKLDENNQYGYSMTKPLPTGCIKENKNVSQVGFNILKESVDLTNKIGHLFAVDTFFFLTQKMQRKNSYFITKFLHQLFRNRKFLKHKNVLHINFQNYLTKQKRNQKCTVALQNHMQIYFQKHLFHFIQEI